MKRQTILGIISLILVWATSKTHAEDFVSHHFNDESFYPYVVPKADQESRVKIVNKRVETHWDEAMYDGTNSGRKAQIKQAAGDHTDGEVRFTQHIWIGFWLKIHSDYMRENTNTNAGLLQVWGHNGVSGAENHMLMLKFDGRNGGALVWQHRYNSVANKTHHLIYPNFPRDKFVRVVMHAKLAERNKGLVQVWVDDELMLNESNQTIGWGEQNANGMINGTYAFGTSIGQYNFFANANFDDAYDGDDHFFDGHLAGETRTVTYDEVALYNGADGYRFVDPDGGEMPTDNTTTVNITKRSDTAFAIDGNRGAANGQSIYLWEKNSDNVDQQWVEINRGGGYYSYQKQGTSHCIDGGNGGIDRQNVFLWICANDNRNQHWKKVSTDSGFFKLVKRNATDYALDGGSGGFNSQNVRLFDSSSTSHNLQWSID